VDSGGFRPEPQVLKFPILDVAYSQPAPQDPLAQKTFLIFFGIENCQLA